MADYRLISFDICPYVQRSVITLEEKGVDYEIEYIDLADKPAWFLDISPFGKVPVLRVGDTVLFESAVINEYLEEAAPGVKLHPADPLRRAHNRAWIEYSSSVLIDAFKLTMAPDEEAARAAGAALRDKLARLEAQLDDGPFFNGAAFSLVDAAVAPLLQRLGWAEEICTDLDLFATTPKVAVWRDLLLARPSVAASTVPDVRERNLAYLRGRGSPTRNMEPSWLGRLAA